MSSQSYDLEELQNLIISEFPSFIAVNYQRIHQETDWKEKTHQCLRVFDCTIRAISLVVAGQYLISDRQRISDPIYNRLLKNDFPQATLGKWLELCFRGIQVYIENNHTVFMKELIGFYWDGESHSANKETAKFSRRLVEMRNEIIHGLPPRDPKEWKGLFEEAHSHVLGVLNRLRFLTNYDLILITEKDQGQCHYQIYRGTLIKNGRSLLNSPNLKEGWFYLTRRDEPREKTFLRLYPFIFGWNKESITSHVPEGKDAALLDKFTNARIYYLATVAWQEFMVDDETLLAEFFYNYEKALDTKKINLDHLEWDDVKQIAMQISSVNVINARGKFNPDLYYQRDDVKRAYHDFVASNKKVFILLGKSGVGKTNFFISQLEDPANNEHIYLFYEGAKLDPKIPLAETFARDFLGSIQFNETQKTSKTRDIFSLMTKNDVLGTKQFIIIIDAINENESAKMLLEQINTLVDKFPYAWLKVAFSCRPEAWKAIKRGVRLSENQYYRQADQDELGIEVSPFVFSSELKPFSRDELPFVYKKYQDIFQLQTPYENISYEIRELLSDPLILKLVARIFFHKPIPEEIKAVEIFQKYVEHLLDAGFLRMTDLRFLENEIMPRMLSDSVYGKAIHASVIQDAITESKQSLFELIHNDDMLANQQRINQSFVNLADTEILTLLGSAIDYELGFKYERFYDYFAGRRIQRLASVVENRESWYSSLIEKTQTHPYLWGAVKYSLTQEFAQSSDQVIGLCFSESQRTKEMMVAALTDFGRTDFEGAEIIIEKLVPHLKKEGKNSIWALLQRKKYDITAWKIAVEVASKIDINWVLLETALAADPSMRSFSVRFSYYLWHHNPSSGFQILEGLIQGITNGFIPNLAALESAIGLSLIIFFENPDDKQTLLNLQSAWRRVIAKVFGVKENASRVEDVVRQWVRERLYSSVLSSILGILREFPRYNVVTNYKYIENSFHMTEEEQSLYHRLLDYVNSVDPSVYAEVANDLENLLPRDNFFLNNAAVLTLNANLAANPIAFLEILERFFERAHTYPMPNTYLSDVPNALGVVLDHHPENDECFKLFMETVQKSQQYYLDPQRRRVMGTNEYPPVIYLGPYLIYQYLREGTVRSEWFDGIVSHALEIGDVQFFECFMEHLDFVGIERRYPNIALNTLAIFFNQKQIDIDEHIRAFLSRLRVYYPDLVDDFLEAQGAASDYVLWIKTHEPEQRVGELIGIRVWLFVRDEVILRNESMRSILLQTLWNVTVSRNFRQWVDRVIREFVNLIYGSSILS